MCISAPKMQTPPPPPKVEELDATQNIVASRESDMKRRKLALSRADTTAGGAMQGPGKKKLGA